MTATFTEKELSKLKSLFQQFDTDESGAITAKEVGLCLEKFGIKLTSNQINNLLKKADIDDSDDIEFEEFVSLCRLAFNDKKKQPSAVTGGDDYEDELTGSRSVLAKASGTSSGKERSLSTKKIENDDDYFSKADGRFYKLIKTLWENAGNPAELEQIREKYGTVNISNALRLKNPVAVKATTAVLLYLAVSRSWDDFLSDEFYNNLQFALENEGNQSNYLWLARLLRLLQVNKDFGDWILAKGDTAEENGVWGRMYEISKSSSDDLQKETSRAVKEGVRAGAESGQYCIIPARIVERMKLDIIWKITDADQAQLTALANERDPYDAGLSKREQIQQLDADNKKTAKMNKEKIEFLTKKIALEKAEKERVQGDLARGQAKLRELQDRVAVKGLSGRKGKGASAIPDEPPEDKTMVAEVVGIQKATKSLTDQVQALAIENASMQQLIADFLAELHSLRIRTQGKAEGMIRVKEELTEIIHDDVEKSQYNILPCVKPSGVATLPIQRPPLSPRLPSTPYTARSPGGRRSPGPPPTADLALPTGWERKLDPKTNRYYYYEVTTRIATWKFPQKAVLLSGESVRRGGHADDF